MDKSSAQKIVKVFAVLNWIFAAILLMSLVWTLVLFAGGGVPVPDELRWVVVAGGIIYPVLAVISVILGIGLWRLRNWARILAIVFGALAVLSGMRLIIFFPLVILVGILSLVIGGLEIYLFAFNSDVKSLFTTGAAAAKKK